MHPLKSSPEMQGVLSAKYHLSHAAPMPGLACWNVTSAILPLDNVINARRTPRRVSPQRARLVCPIIAKHFGIRIRPLSQSGIINCKAEKICNSWWP
ncbi:hypothetical protein TNCT_639501 [Trichonephila clavata]|uniref:Uncharacterized protein n=1 Tax=Trichonephila clavata TaxID=2740835 RepID=A0A8X6HUK2_TRICU|nr:hypothetical protein TNCT_639501 [Trichonephila clavata]